MHEDYDSDNYTNVCKCGVPDLFSRYKEVHEKEILSIGGGFIDVEDSDLHTISEWIYTCESCGRESDDLEDLLEEIPDEEDEDD